MEIKDISEIHRLSEILHREFGEVPENLYIRCPEVFKEMEEWSVPQDILEDGDIKVYQVNIKKD